jgi:F-type H+-transporting ATPase subunit epsilon
VVALDVHLVTPEREVWTGEATMVVARGVEGDVGVLKGHAPMLITLAIGPLFIHQGDRVQGVAVDGGFLHVTSRGEDTRVDVLAEHAELQDEIDLAAAERLRDAAEERLSQHADAEARDDLAKALARIRATGRS